MPEELAIEQKAKRIAEQLDHAHIAEAALWAANSLDRAGVAHVKLTPNDGTLYQIVVIDTPVWTENGIQAANQFTFGSSMGTIYPWHGHKMHFDYVRSKWVADDNLWTAVVFTEFMNALAERLVDQ